jgi:HEAT repeat protein
MTKRGVFWAGTACVALGAFAFLLPGSPLYLPKVLVSGRQHDGRSVRSWMASLDSSDPDERRNAIFALGAIGPEAAEGVPALAAILTDDPDRDARSQAALALSKMHPASCEAVDALTAALEDEEPFVRMNSSIALVKLGKDARPAIPALIKGVADRRNHRHVGAFVPTICGVMLVALGRASAGTDEAVPTLIAVLKNNPTAEMRRAAAQGLGEIGTSARPATDLLRPLLQDGNPDVRHAAEHALKKIEASGS